jgi:hypothetical protein
LAANAALAKNRIEKTNFIETPSAQDGGTIPELWELSGFD